MHLQDKLKLWDVDMGVWESVTVGCDGVGKECGV